eukprot:comp19374_c0_seq1/m.22334 comp19374_c0_seq1/g.22334  ORF comp19374_c0_seq1/g.22334 comp19374_c0_seq1/m.22334 type:complete len:242 (-) comp19374_c0_seq1:498-1223(-)
MTLEKEQVKKAVGALVKHVQGGQAGNNLLEGAETILLVVALKNVPEQTSKKAIRIPIPHSLHQEGETEVCLITKDPQADYKKLLEEKNVTVVSKVLGISKLREKHSKSHEQKRQLLSQYDVFLADARVLPLLPPLLGKKFFEKKKQPVPVDLTKKDISKEISKAINATYLYLGLGACVAVRIAHTGQTEDEIVANIVQGMDAIAEKIPKKWRTVQSVHIKTSESVALPVYASLPTDTTMAE